MTVLLQQAERAESASSDGHHRHRQAGRDAAEADQEAVLQRQRGEVQGAAQAAAPDRRAGSQGRQVPADLRGARRQGHEGHHRHGRRGRTTTTSGIRSSTRRPRRATCATSSSRPSRRPSSIYAQLKAGNDKTWCTLAKKFSQDPSSKDNCGKLTVSKGQTVPAFDKVAFSEKTKTIHAPIHDATYGWFVIEPLSIVHPRTTTPEKQVARDDQAAAPAAEEEPGDHDVVRRPDEELLQGRQDPATRSATRRRPIPARRRPRRPPRPSRRCRSRTRSSSSRS